MGLKGLNMGRWLWKIGELLVMAGIVVFIVVPGYIEDEFVKRLYTANPILCIALLVAVAVFVISLTVHALQERKGKRKIAEPRKETPYRGTL